MRFQHIELLTVEEGHEIVIETAQILPGVTLKVYDQTEAELIVEGGERVEIPFTWTDKARDMIDKIAVDLIELVNV